MASEPQGQEGVWRRAPAWRWTFSLTILATAIVLLVAPWRHPSPPPMPSLATYSAPGAQPVAPSHPSTGIAPMQPYTPPSTPAPRTIQSPTAGANPSSSVAAARPPSLVDPDPPTLSTPGTPAGPTVTGSTVSGVRWQAGGSGIGGTISGGGLVAEYCCAGALSTVYPNVYVSQGKHYLELTISVRPGADHPDTWTDAGLAPATASRRPMRPGGELSLGGKRKELVHGDVVMMAIDMDAGAYYWGVNGKWRNADPAGGNGEPIDRGVSYAPFVSISASSQKQTPEGDRWIANFGAKAFKYAPPAGYGAYGAPPTVRVASSSASASASADPYTGQFFSDTVAIAGTTVPLPEGRWRGVGYVKQSAADQTVMLARIGGDRLLEFAAIRVQAQPSAAGFDAFPSCTRDDLYARKTASNQKGGEQSCWWVNHAARMWNQPAFNLAAANLAALKVAAPPTMINSGVRKAGKTTAVTAFYYSNPQVAGFDEPATDWRNSPWHKDNVGQNAQRKAYLDGRVDWTRSWAQLFKPMT